MKSSGTLAAASSLRIVLVPVIMALIAIDDDIGSLAILAGVLFALAAVTDFFDGYLARRWNMTTTLGSFLDTTADKLLVTGVLIALVAVERVSPWIATIIIGRELVIMGLRGVVAADGLVMAPSWWGKVKTNSRSSWPSCGPTWSSRAPTSTSGSWWPPRSSPSPRRSTTS